MKNCSIAKETSKQQLKRSHKIGEIFPNPISDQVLTPNFWKEFTTQQPSST